MRTALRHLGPACLLILLALSSGCTRQDVPQENTELDLSRARELFGVPLERQAPVNQQAIIVRVDERNITQADLNLEAAKLLRAVRQPIPPERVAQARQKIVSKAIENLVVSALLINAAQHETIEVSEAEIKEALETLKSNVVKGSTWEEFLTKNKLTEEQINSKITDDIKLSKLIKQQTDRLPPPPDTAIKAFYDGNPDQFKVPDAVEARHILIASTAQDDEATHNRKQGEAEKIRRQLMTGADFAQLATEKGMQNGGNLGVIFKGKSLPAIETAAFNLEPNAISELVPTKFGFHILQVVRKIPARTVPLEEARPNIVSFLTNQRQQEVMQKYIKELRDQAKIEFLKK